MALDRYSRLHAPLVSLALLLLMALVVTACGGGGTTPAPAATPTPTASQQGGGTSPTATPTPQVDLQAQAAAHFGRKTITLMVGYAPGGGQDTNARLVGKYLPQHIPGSPRVIVQNLTGADGLIAAQRTMQQPANGLTVVLVNNVLSEQQALSGQPAPGFSIFDSIYLGNVQTATPGASAMLCTRTDIATTFDQAIQKARELGRPLNAGVFRAGSWGEILPKYFDLPFQPVPGYSGTATILQAIDQKELEILIDACTYDQLTRARPEWIERGNVVTPIANRDGDDLGPAMSMFQTAGWQVPPLLEDVWPMDDLQKQILEAGRSMSELTTHPWMVRGGTPDWVVRVWQDALEGVTKDPGFVAEYEAIARVAGWTPGEVYQKQYTEDLPKLSGPALQAMRDFAGIRD